MYIYQHLNLDRATMTKVITILTLSCLTLLSTLQVSMASEDTNLDPALTPYQLSYAASYNGMDIKAERQLTFDGNQYVLTTTAKNMLSSIEEEGTFTLDTGQRIVDQGYQYKRNILGMKKTEKLKYDRNSGVANYKAKKKERQVTLKDGLLNRLTYQVQLQRDLVNQVSPLQYQVISRGRVKQYNFETLGEEVLDTPMGKITALKVRRVREDDDRETFFWFAPQWNYLMVQLWQREKGGEDYKITLKEGNLDKQRLTLSMVNE